MIGCSYENSLQKLAQKSLNYEAESNMLNAGIGSYEAGEFEKAAEIFEALSKSSSDESVRRKALYGLVCTRLLLAQTQEEFGDAVVLWENWSHIRGTKLGAEDPRMLAPLFQKIFPTLPESCSETEENEAEEEDIDEEAEESAPELPNVIGSSKPDTTQKEPRSGLCSGLLKARDKEIQTLKTSNAKMKKDIQQLKDQINSLEAIHRKIQEKKKEIVP